MNEVQGIVNDVSRLYYDGMITESEALAKIVSAVAQCWDSVRAKEEKEEDTRAWALQLRDACDRA